MKPTFIVLTGDGVNCERETKLALENSQAQAKILTLNELIADKSHLNRAQGLVLAGGFSFGDEINSGKLLAYKIRHELGDEFFHFLSQRKAVLGICNGFQVLAHLGVFNTEKNQFYLDHNDPDVFIDQWSKLKVEGKDSPWLSKLDGHEIWLPIRHREGRAMSAHKINSEQIALSYVENHNKSVQNIAGLLAHNGLTIGMMPHPECAVFKEQMPQFSKQASGKLIFDSIVEFLNQS